MAECLLVRAEADKIGMLGREYLVLYEEKGAADPGMRSVVEES